VIASASSATARTASLTAIAMCCFAANSLLCRLALAAKIIDPASFTLLRVLSASAILVAIVAIRRRSQTSIKSWNWRSTVALFVYLIGFSFAYTWLSAGAGALVLFGSVQLVMYLVALWHGEKLPLLSWAALAVAAFGLVWLAAPGLDAPDPIGFALMTAAGVAWGVFSLLARGSSDPVGANMANFVGCIPLAATASVLSIGDFNISMAGVVLAVASGAIASGLGYAIWYAALAHLPRTHAAAVQLSVPAIAALGGVMLLSEPVTPRLVVASFAVLGGVAVVVYGRPSSKRA
jgi:drug/metabolite transporter (DMT)-like permease